MKTYTETDSPINNLSFRAQLIYRNLVHLECNATPGPFGGFTLTQISKRANDRAPSWLDRQALYELHAKCLAIFLNGQDPEDESAEWVTCE